jgi:ADP-heptose:LPS heptosyltransferase
MTHASSPLKGRYLVRNPLWNAWLRASDAVLGLRERRPAAPAPPRRLLLAFGGHLGDAVIATSVLAPIRSAWPHVEIGVVTGSWNRDVLANHSDIRWLHLADHWKLNRSAMSWLARAIRSRSSHRAALREILDVGYDAAIDLYPYYPNASWLLDQARIPTRIGYVSGGGGPRYTHPLEWMPGGHVSGDHLRLVATLGVVAVPATMGYKLPENIGGAAVDAARKLREAGASPDKCVVLHMGAGTAKKSWPAASWTIVAQELLMDGMSVVLTGAGKADAARTRDLVSRVPRAVNLCDALTWNEFRQVLSEARVTITVDTVAAHLSAAEGTPTIVVMTGMDDPARWRPLGRHVTILTERVPCSPCYLPNGCAAMSCIVEVTTDSVLAATRRHVTGRAVET